MESEEESCQVCVESSELGDGTLICTKRSKRGKIFYIDNPGRTADNCGEYFDENSFEDLINTLDDVGELGVDALEELDEELDEEEIEFGVD